MFDDQHQQEQGMNAASAQSVSSPVEDIFSETEQAPEGSSIPGGVAPASPQPGPPSALSQGKLQPAGAQPAAQVPQAVSSRFPVGRVFAIGGVSIVVIGGVIGGALWLQGRGASVVTPPDLGTPETNQTQQSSSQETNTTTTDQTTDTTPDTPENTDTQTSQQSGSVIDTFNDRARDNVLDPFGGQQATPKDTDQDGLTDEEENSLGTNIRLVDSDSDGLSDWEEVSVFGTDPLSQDTDGDGYSDGEEVQNGYNPNGDGKLLNFGDAVSN